MCIMQAVHSAGYAFEKNDGGVITSSLVKSFPAYARINPFKSLRSCMQYMLSLAIAGHADHCTQAIQHDASAQDCSGSLWYPIKETSMALKGESPGSGGIQDNLRADLARSFPRFKNPVRRLTRPRLQHRRGFCEGVRATS